MADQFPRPPGLYDFPPTSLVGVIFGYRLEDDKIRNIIPWFEGRALTPKFYRAEVKDREFGLRIEAFDPNTL